MKRNMFTAFVTGAVALCLVLVGLAYALSGTIIIDGSSTVGPVSSRVAEEFMKEYPGVNVIVGMSGTGGGFKKFVKGESHINDASRPVKQKELDAMAAEGIDIIEIPVAFDGLAVLVNPENDWVDYLTVAELKKMFEPAATGKITNWKQVRSGFPDVPIKSYVPGTDSGTFEYFTEAIIGEAGALRSDCDNMSEDDNVLVQGIAGGKGAIGFFGYAYYEHNKDKLKLVPVKNGDDDPVAPNPDSIMDGTYQPLSRPLFIYVSTEARGQEEVDEFVHYYLDNAPWLVPEVGYVQLPQDIYDLGREHYVEGVTGSMFGGGGATPGVSLKDLMSKLSK